jgi:hypothetical protein
MCDCRRGMDWWMDLLTAYTHHSELQVIIALSLISTAPTKPFPVCSVITRRSLATVSNNRDSSASRAQVLTSQPSLQSGTKVKVKVKVTLRLTVSESVSLGVEPHLGLMTRYLLLFDSFGLVFVGRPLWREDGWLFYMLLALASVVFLRSESPGTRDHILLSQIRDFPLRRLLRLTWSRWMYSTPLN